MRILWPILLLCAACGDGAGPVPGPPKGPGSVMIVNRSQYLILELRLHQSPDYRSAANVLGSPLTENDRHLFHGQGDWFVTAYHEWYAGGPTRAYTTADPIAVANETGYRLSVFDMSFRLEPDEYVPPAGTSTTGTSTHSGAGD